MERPAWLLTVKFDSCNNLYHPFILIVSFCVLSSLIIKHENIIIIIKCCLLSPGANWPEWSKLSMQLSGFDICSAIHNGTVVSCTQLHNRIVHVCSIQISRVVLH